VRLKLALRLVRPTTKQPETEIAPASQVLIPMRFPSPLAGHASTMGLLELTLLSDNVPSSCRNLPYLSRGPAGRRSCGHDTPTPPAVRRRCWARSASGPCPHPALSCAVWRCEYAPSSRRNGHSCLAAVQPTSRNPGRTVLAAFGVAVLASLVFDSNVPFATWWLGSLYTVVALSAPIPFNIIVLIAAHAIPQDPDLWNVIESVAVTAIAIQAIVRKRHDVDSA